MRRDGGFALLWALFLVLLVGATSFVLLERDRTLRRDERTDLEALSAFHAAEGGLEHARHALRASGDWHGDTIRVGRCDVEIRVRPLDEGGWRVTSRAEPGHARLDVRLVPTTGGLPAIPR